MAINYDNLLVFICLHLVFKNTIGGPQIGNIFFIFFMFSYAGIAPIQKVNWATPKSQYFFLFFLCFFMFIYVCYTKAKVNWAASNLNSFFIF